MRMDPWTALMINYVRRRILKRRRKFGWRSKTVSFVSTLHSRLLLRQRSS